MTISDNGIEFDVNTMVKGLETELIFQPSEKLPKNKHVISDYGRAFKLEYKEV